MNAMPHSEPELQTARTLLMRLVPLVARGRGSAVCREVNAFLRRTNPEALPLAIDDPHRCAATPHDALMICSRCTKYWHVNEASPCKVTHITYAHQPQHPPEKQP